MTFRIMAFVMAIAGCILGLRFVFAGASVLREWSLDPTDSSLVMARRIGVLYLGLAVMFYLGRNAPPSDLRSGICIGIGGAVVLLAAVGVLEYSAGRVGPRIFVSAVAELVLAAGFAWAWFSDRVSG